MKTTCPYCGSKDATESQPTSYDYKESGLDNVVLTSGVTRTKCPKCKRQFVSINNELQLLQVLAIAILARPGFISGKELRFIRQQCHLTQEQLAKGLGIGRRPTIAEWESSGRPRRERGSEILLRLSLLSAFRQMLDIEGNSHLAPAHIDGLRSFEEQFTRKFLGYIEQGHKGTLEATKEDRGAWRTPEFQQLQPC